MDRTQLSKIVATAVAALVAAIVATSAATTAGPAGAMCSDKEASTCADTDPGAQP